MVATRLRHQGRVLEPPCGQAGKMKFCLVRAHFPVSGDSHEAGELMAAKYAPGHSSRVNITGCRLVRRPQAWRATYKAVSN